MTLLPLSDYDVVLVAFSGGKDSLACLLHLLDLGAVRENIELHHNCIDGMEGSNLMDWPCTPDYCRKVAQALGVKIYFSWRQGGFEREMLRENQRTAPCLFETPRAGLKMAGGKLGKLSTRRMFPQVSADLSVRWCSSSAKIEVFAMALRNQDRFLGKTILVVTGERAEESSARAKYKEFELHRTNCLKRTVHHWRPIKHWTREQVWQIIGRHRINPHPAYRLGWGRVSCMKCIFGSANQWASAKVIDETGVLKIAQYESEFGKTIHRTKSVVELCAQGQAYDMKPEDMKAAMSVEFNEPVILENWVLPSGAYGETCGPT